MLRHFAVSAARSWTTSYQRVYTSNVVLRLFASQCTSSIQASDDQPIPYKRFVEKRLQSVRTSLGITLRENPSLRPLSPEEFESWKEAIKVSNFEDAVNKCRERLLSAPSWVLLYLLSSKVYTPSHATAAVHIMLQHFPKADVALQPALIILTIRFLARQRVEAPIPNLIKLFLLLDLPEPATQFNLLLRSLSHFNPSPIPAKAATRLIDAMHGRQLKLHSRTYRSLLSNSLVSLELAKKLQRSMQLEGVKPNPHHLEAYLRVFAHQGAVHASARYLNLIREQAQKTHHMIPHGVELSERGARAVKSDDSFNTRWNTEFMMSFKRNTGSAFQYLRDMVDVKDFDPIIPQVTRKESRISGARGKGRPLIWKHRTLATDWATVLNVAGRDRRVNSAELLRLFEKTKAAGGSPPTVPMFTVLMRALSRKGDYETALSAWRRCCISHPRRRKIDTKALTVAMDVLVTNGLDLEAFDTLVESTGILIDEAKRPPKRCNVSISRRRKRHLFSKHAKIDTPLVNALMNSYQKNSRPDLVFKLWDVFYPLFGVHPNADTLTIVLDAALSVAAWNRTFRGLLEHFGVPDLFRRASPKPSSTLKDKSRSQIVQHVQMNIKRGSLSSIKEDHSAEEDEEGRSGYRNKKVAQEARLYMRKTSWDGELAAPKAIKLFQEILLGNYPELKEVVPPARAVWPDEAHSASPIRDALSSLGSRLRGNTNSQSPNDEPRPKPLLLGPSLSLSPSPPTPPSTTSPHPQITPTAQSFSTYILLLSRTNRPSQIPLTLAWMRYLHIKPFRRSLAIALALWSEASMRGPLIEMYGARESEFEKLRRWLEGWLGREGMPSEVAISWAFRKLREEREMR